LARTVEETDDLRHFVDSAEGAAHTFASRNDELAATLAAAPGGLATLRAFLVDLESTAQPLGDAARRLSATAPHLEDTLDELPPFRNAIRPTLHQASEVAPSLSRLGEQATPVIERSGPALAALDRFADAVEPTVAVLGDTGMPDILGLLEGWGRSIQGRDGLSHQFHGRAAFGTDFFRHLIASYPDKKTSNAKKGKDDRKPSVASEDQGDRTPAARPPAESRARHVLDDLRDKVKGLTGDVLEKVKEAAGKIGSKVKDSAARLIGRLRSGRRSDAGQSGDSVNKLLDYLVGP
jgi:ABC-type transporter Mla subunit MlaD